MKYALVALGLAGALGIMVYVSGGTQSFMANILSTQNGREEVIDVNATRSVAEIGATTAGVVPEKTVPKKTAQKKTTAVKKSAPSRSLSEAKQENVAVITVSSSMSAPVLPAIVPIVVPPPAPVIPITPPVQTVVIATTSSDVDAPVVSAPTSSLANIGAVLISEVMTGRKDDADYDFIELYNTGDAPIVLTGWTIKKRTSSGAESGLVAAARLKDKSIPAHGYLLLANETGYTGTPPADVVWPDSYSLAAANNSIALYKNGGAVADEAKWQEIPDGGAIVRDSWSVSSFHAVATPTPGGANVQ